MHPRSTTGVPVSILWPLVIFAVVAIVVVISGADFPVNFIQHHSH